MSELTPIRPAYEQIGAQIKQAIVSGAFAAGSRLPNETTLASTFAVSRATVREALRGLGAEGLIRTTKGTSGGSFVHLPTVGDVSDRLHDGISLLARTSAVSLDEFMEFRAFIEPMAAGLLAIRSDAEAVSRLGGALPDVNQELSIGGRYRINRDFHFYLIDLCGNTLLNLAAQPVFAVLHTRLDRSNLRPEFFQAVAAQHAEITEAISGGDADAASSLTRSHLQWLHHRYAEAWIDSTDPEKIANNPGWADD